LPDWLTYSGRFNFTHISGHPSAVDRESSLVKNQRSTVVYYATNLQATPGVEYRPTLLQFVSIMKFLLVVCDTDLRPSISEYPFSPTWTRPRQGTPSATCLKVERLRSVRRLQCSSSQRGVIFSSLRLNFV